MKKLENEYKQLMQNETPDLWEKISAGIDAKIASETDDKSAEGIEAKVSGKTGTGFWKKYSLPLAACIAALFCVPLVVTGFIRMAGGGFKSAESEAMDTAAAEEFYYTTTENADAPAEEYYEDAVAEEETMESESVPAEEPEAVLDSMSADDTAEGIQEESASAEAAPFAEEKQMTDSEESIVLTILKLSKGIDDLAETEATREKGTLYYLTTEEKGDCTVYVPAEQAFEENPNQTLKILVKPGNDEYDYIFVEVAK